MPYCCNCQVKSDLRLNIVNLKKVICYRRQLPNFDLLAQYKPLRHKVGWADTGLADLSEGV